MTQTQYAPLFEGKTGDVLFLPYEELMADTKHEARAIGRAQRPVMLLKTGLNFAGRVKKLEPGLLWVRVPFAVEGHENPLYLCPVQGPMFDQIQDQIKIQEAVQSQANAAQQVETVSTTEQGDL